MRVLALILLVASGCLLALGGPDMRKITKRQIDILSSNGEQNGLPISPMLLGGEESPLGGILDGTVKMTKELPLPIPAPDVLGGVGGMVGSLLPLKL